MSDMQNDPDDPRAPDPDAGVIERGDGRPAEGRDETDDDAESSLHPGGGTKRGPASDDARAQPYDEQPIGLRMVEQPLDQDANDANRHATQPDA